MSHDYDSAIEGHQLEKCCDPFGLKMDIKSLKQQNTLLKRKLTEIRKTLEPISSTSIFKKVVAIIEQ